MSVRDNVELLIFGHRLAVRECFVILSVRENVELLWGGGVKGLGVAGVVCV